MTTPAADVPARHILASDPLLRWDAIATQLSRILLSAHVMALKPRRSAPC